MDDQIKPSNAELAGQIADAARALLLEQRGYGLDISEHNRIWLAAHDAFDSATASQARKRAA